MPMRQKKFALQVANGLGDVLQGRNLSLCCLIYKDVENVSQKVSVHPQLLSPELDDLCCNMLSENRHPVIDAATRILSPVNVLAALEKDAETSHEHLMNSLLRDEKYQTAYYLPFRDSTGNVFYGFVVSKTEAFEPRDISIAFADCYNKLSELEVAYRASPPSDSLLTDRERECLQYAAKGCTEKQTARLLNISPHTVHTHLESAKRKFGTKSKLAAVLKAIRMDEMDPAEAGVS